MDIIEKQQGGIEDLLVDANLPDQITQIREGQPVQRTKLNMRTIPAVGKKGDLNYKSLEEVVNEQTVLIAAMQTTINNFTTSIATDYYTRLEVDTMMAGKLGKTEKAADSTLFEGKPQNEYELKTVTTMNGVLDTTTETLTITLG